MAVRNLDALMEGNAESPNCPGSELESVLFRSLVEHGGVQPVGLFDVPLSGAPGAPAIVGTCESIQGVASRPAVDCAKGEG